MEGVGESNREAVLMKEGAGRSALKLFPAFMASCLALFGLLAAAAELYLEGSVAMAPAAPAAFGAVRPEGERCRRAERLTGGTEEDEEIYRGVH
jgi:hypothetical protein